LKAYEIPLPPLAEQRRIVARIEALFARTRRARTDLLRIAPLASRYRKRIVDAVLEAGQDAHWPFRTLQDLALDTRNGISAKPADAPPGIPILRISAVRPGRVVLTDTRYHQSSNHKDDATYRLRDRDLLFVRFNGNPELVASCGMVRSLQGECVYPDKLIRMRLNERLALPEYVEMAAGSSMARKHLKTHIKTAAGQHGISGADLKSLPLPVPDVETQREAAATNAIQRATADAVEREATRALALLDHLEQSILARAFRGDLVPQDPTDEPAAATLSRLAETTVPPAPRRRRASAA
jgi:type I restriction enzyme S subunit